MNQQLPLAQRLDSVVISVTTDQEISDSIFDFSMMLFLVDDYSKIYRIDSFNIQCPLSMVCPVLPSKGVPKLRINLPLFSIALPSNSCCFCILGLLLLIQHFQQVL